MQPQRVSNPHLFAHDPVQHEISHQEKQPTVYP
jgi:hypothetical protein